MNGKPRHKITDPEFVKALQAALDAGDMDRFFDMVHDAVTEDPAFTVRDVLAEPAKANHKLRQLKGILSVFVKREDYEKCGILNDIIRDVEKQMARARSPG
jgi:hypothetical protein